MAMKTVTVQWAQKRFSVKDDPYLLMKLSGVGYASCWIEDLFETIQRAKDERKPIALDICESDKNDQYGNPYLNVMGIEDSGQQKAFEGETETMRCKMCNGTGVAQGQACENCNGRGLMEVSRG